MKHFLFLGIVLSAGRALHTSLLNQTNNKFHLQVFRYLVNLHRKWAGKHFETLGRVFEVGESVVKILLQFCYQICVFLSMLDFKTFKSRKMDKILVLYLRFPQSQFRDKSVDMIKHGRY